MHTRQNHPLLPKGKVVIDWAKPGELARTVISRSSQRVTYKVPSFKTGKMLYAESANECAFYRRIEADPLVKQVMPQPATLYYRDGDRNRKHFPDCLVVKSTLAQTFVEIKSSHDPELSEAYRRADLISPNLQEQGYGYEVVTSDDIKVSPYFENARTLLRLGRRPVNVMDAESIRLMLNKRDGTSWRDVIQGALGPNAPFVVARMILEGWLVFDSTKPLGAETIISPLPAKY